MSARHNPIPPPHNPIMLEVLGIPRETLTDYETSTQRLAGITQVQAQAEVEEKRSESERNTKRLW